MLSQTAMIELDPVAGRLITPVTAECFAVYVPVQAMDALKRPDDPYGGVTELLRQQMLTGAPLFGLEDEGELSMRLGVMPRSIGGAKKVSETVRLAHNCAVNFLRKRRYVYAAQVLAANAAVTPAIISRTALDMFNAVLNPDDFINGALNLELSGAAPVKGLGFQSPATNPVAGLGPVRETGSTAGRTMTGSLVASNPVNAGTGYNRLAVEGMSGGIPNVRAELDGLFAAGITLTDFYNAKTMDDLTRTMRTIIDANPVDGEEQVLRWASGLEVDTDKNPFLLYATERVFGQDYRSATDGAGMEQEISMSKFAVRMNFNVPVPRTELGGVVVTFLTVKPDETLYQQPHPILSDVWELDNMVADELKLDPVAVIARDVQAGVPVGSENNVVFYTGHNELKRLYVNYGFNRALDPTTVEARTSMWQLAIPASVTPENIIYPPDLPHYPFLDQNAEVATYLLTSNLVAQTPMFFGPSPVEEVGIIRDEDIFEIQGSSEEGATA